MQVAKLKYTHEVNYACILSGYVWQLKGAHRSEPARTLEAGLTKSRRKAFRHARRAERKHIKENP